MDEIRVYWGGGLFDHKELTANALLAEAVNEMSKGRYVPILPQFSEANQERALNIRDSDYDMLLSCDIMLANFDGPDLDSGTVAEFIFAKMLNYPTVSLRTDFRKQSESQSSPDPWNLMCSGFPRSKSRIIHSMELMRRIKLSSPSETMWIKEYHTYIASLLISDFDEVCATIPLFNADELFTIYSNTIRATGGGMEKIYPAEKIRQLIADKCSRRIY